MDDVDMIRTLETLHETTELLARTPCLILTPS